MKRIALAACLLLLLTVFLTGCDLNQVITLETPVPGPAHATANPPVATAAPGVPVSGGPITLPGARLNVYAPGPNPFMNQAGPAGAVAGILLGLWHGIISPVTLILSFLNSSVQMYEVHNDGGPYNLGFLLGIVILIGLFGFIRR